MAGADPLSVGERCGTEEPGQLSLVPFECDACRQVYCRHHRMYRGHKCPRGAGRQRTIVLCPFCGQSVRCIAGKGPQSVLEKHQSKDCNPGKETTVSRKVRCPVLGCKGKLTLTTTCKACQGSMCMAHRLPKAHTHHSRVRHRRAHVPHRRLVKTAAGIGLAAAQGGALIGVASLLASRKEKQATEERKGPERAC